MISFRQWREGKCRHGGEKQCPFQNKNGFMDLFCHLPIFTHSSFFSHFSYFSSNFFAHFFSPFSPILFLILLLSILFFSMLYLYSAFFFCTSLCMILGSTNVAGLSILFLSPYYPFSAKSLSYQLTSPCLSFICMSTFVKLRILLQFFKHDGYSPPCLHPKHTSSSFMIATFFQ